MTTVTIQGVKLPVKEGKQPFVPSVNEAYSFHPNTYDILMDILENRCVLSTGHAGTGKSSLPQQIAARINQPCVRPVMNAQMSTADFVGYNTVKGGELVWVDGILTKAMREGWWLIIDEIDFADPAILSSLNTVTEPVSASNPDRVIILKENGGEILTAHKDFRIIATANTVGCMEEYRHLYRGANVLNSAFLDRFRVYFFDYISQEEEIEVLIKTLPRIPKEWATLMVKVGNLIREAFKNQEVTQSFSMRRLFDWAQMICRHLDKEKAAGTLGKDSAKKIPLKSAESTIFSRITLEEKKVIEGIINRVLG